MSKFSGSNKPIYSKKDIVVIAVWTLGGVTKYMHLEDVAIKAGELSPRSFSWKKYPEQINLELVRLALKNELASKERRVIGSMRDGWMVTPLGVLWCVNNLDVSFNEKSQGRIKKEIDRVRTTDVFIKVLANQIDMISKVEVKALMRIDEYSSKRTRTERTVALLNVAILNQDLDQVLKALQHKGLIELEVIK